jgi:hypothetical protein
VLRITKRKHVWLEVTRGGVTLLLSGSLVGPLRNGVLDAIGVSDTGHSAIRLSAVPDLGRLLEYCKAREEDIAKVVRESRKQVKAARRAPRRELNELGYAPQVRDRLSALGGDPRGNPRKGAALSLRFRRSKAGRGVEQVLRIDLYEGGGMLGFRCLPDLGKRLSEEFPQLVVRTSKHKPGCDVSGEGTMVAVLDWVADELARSAS